MLSRLPIGCEIKGKSEVQKSTKNNDIENGLQNLLKKRSNPTQCCLCGCSHLVYRGLGKFECSACNYINYNNYGKAREVLDTYGILNMYQLMEKSGLTKYEIKNLIEEGSLAYSAGGIRLKM